MPTVQVKGALTLPDRILLNTDVSIVSVHFSVQFPSWFDHLLNSPNITVIQWRLKYFNWCYSGNSKTLFSSTVNRSSIFFVRSSMSGLSSEWYGQLYIAISRKVVGKSARDNPERHCGWFWVHCSSEKFKRIGTKMATKMCWRVLTESNKSRFDSYSRQERCIDHMPYYLSGLSRALFFRQPFSK